MARCALVLGALLVVALATTPAAAIDVVPNLNLTSYLGRWYQMYTDLSGAREQPHFKGQRTTAMKEDCDCKRKKKKSATEAQKAKRERETCRENHWWLEQAWVPFVLNNPSFSPSFRLCACS